MQVIMVSLKIFLFSKSLNVQVIKKLCKLKM